ncbi:sulfotransferase [Thalassotalea crassostreae]|uniref:sulfotransferase n=1 Tax=Thalassotalea crassostreae TaxID=1763536 RepID=UPI00083916F3|nr:sulfotransferase [Thalassotalea crassostreae]
MSKIFIIGLPRTATTSCCLALLNLGFKVAHTCYTKQCLQDAQVIADTPIFNDYPLLDKRYPDAKFIYLQRDLINWLPSIKQLLNRMQHNVLRQDGGFNPIIKRCFTETFAPFTIENINCDQFLTLSYQHHQQAALEHFKDRPEKLLSIDVSRSDSYQRLLKFLSIDNDIEHGSFEKINIAGKVTAWNDIKSTNKIDSTRKGRIDKDLYSN